MESERVVCVRSASSLNVPRGRRWSELSRIAARDVEASPARPGWVYTAGPARHVLVGRPHLEAVDARPA